jgi:hypothetical protein
MKMKKLKISTQKMSQLKSPTIKPTKKLLEGGFRLKKRGWVGYP